jgi:hypothetical protein
MAVRNPALLDVPGHAPQRHESSAKADAKQVPFGLAPARATDTGDPGSPSRPSSRSFVPLRLIRDRDNGRRREIAHGYLV